MTIAPIEFATAEMMRGWAADPHAIHKRPPFRAHNFDGDDRYWVVGSTSVSVLHGWHGSEAIARTLADALNAAALPSTYRPEQSAKVWKPDVHA